MAPLPLHTAGPYVAAAYIAFFVIVLLYVAIMASKLMRSEKALSELTEQVERGRQASEENGR
jgi:hypothetical protein